MERANRPCSISSTGQMKTLTGRLHLHVHAYTKHIPSYTTCTDPPQVWIREGIDIGYLRQNPSLEAGLTVAETVAQGLRAKVVKQTQTCEVSLDMHKKSPTLMLTDPAHIERTNAERRAEAVCASQRTLQ